MRSAQRIDRGELQPQNQPQQRRHWRTRAEPLAEGWRSVLVPMLEQALQLEPRPCCCISSRSGRKSSCTSAKVPSRAALLVHAADDPWVPPQAMEALAVQVTGQPTESQAMGRFPSLRLSPGGANNGFHGQGDGHQRHQGRPRSCHLVGAPGAAVLHGNPLRHQESSRAVI